jgi:hypothetical protein
MHLVFIIVVIMAYPWMVTAVHELGHALAATLLGYEVKGIWFGLDGTPAYVNIAGPFNGSDYDVIQLSGGLMVALFFVIAAVLFSRLFLLMVPFHMIDGCYEMIGPIPDWVETIMAMSWPAFIAIVAFSYIRRF